MEARSTSTAQSQQPVRRSSTLPVKLQDTSERRARPVSRADPGVETLYIHPAAKILSFSTSSGSIRPSTSNGRAATVEEKPGTLPWNTRVERTLAVGPLKVYRAPGSVAFINCGNALQPILPKSQCWCVDDTSSKFVLQIHRPQYWRIELPHTAPEDLRRLEEFRDILARVLLYEKTPCPFRRSFTVQLPEPPQQPIRKRPWKPVTRTSDNVPPVPPIPSLYKAAGPQPSIAVEVDSADEYYSAMSDEDVDPVPETVEDEYSDVTEDDNATPTNQFPQSYVAPGMESQKSIHRSEVLKTGHSLMAPPKLTLLASPPSKPIKKRSSTSHQSSSNTRPDSLIVLPPSPPESSTNSPQRIRPSTSSAIDHDISPWGLPYTPSIQSDSSSEIANTHVTADGQPNSNMLLSSTLENRATRSRAKTDAGSRIRTYSPLPPAVNLHSPTFRKPRHLQTKSHIPTAIIQKTCEILLSPPSHLIQLMVNIASRITAGEWRGMMFGYGEGGEKIFGQWDYSDGDALDTWGEDDYGMSLGGASQMKRRTMPGGCDSWDSD